MYTLATIAALLAVPGAHANLNQLMQAAGKKYFGSATDNGELSDTAYVNILKNPLEFGQITPGNTMKWQYTEPTQNQFDFSQGDVIQQFAANNGQLLRCHNLVWHNQLPNWVSSGSWTTSTLTAVIQNHIANEAGHYKGKCYAWDVVNEALNDDGSYRSDVFYNTMGSSYIPIAFKAAAAADPNAKLYYNDYNIEYSGAKQQAAINIVKLIKSAGAKIDGVGLQGHFIVGGTPGRSALASVLQSYLTAGATEVAYTELDIRFSSLPASSSGLQQQATDYVNVVGACLDVAGCIGVTVWDYTDKYSWVPGTFSGAGSACLWDSTLAPKPAYTSVSSLLVAAAKSSGGVTSVPAGPTTTSAPSKPSSTLSTVVTKTTTASGATQTHWGQCGGNGWSGPTACASPYTCQFQNPWYSQCL